MLEILDKISSDYSEKKERQLKLLDRFNPTPDLLRCLVIPLDNPTQNFQTARLGRTVVRKCTDGKHGAMCTRKRNQRRIFCLEQDANI